MSVKVGPASLLGHLWPGSSPSTHANGTLLQIEQQVPSEATFTCSAFCPTDNTRMVIGDSTGALYHVSMKKNKIIVAARIPGRHPITAAAFLSEGVVVVASAMHLFIVDLDHGRVEQKSIRTPHSNQITKIVVPTSRKNFAATMSSDSVALWRTAPFQCTHHTLERGMDGGRLVMNFANFVGLGVAEIANPESSSPTFVLVTIEAQGFLTIWTVDEFRAVKRVDVAPYKPTSLAVCSDYLIIGTKQGKLLCFSSDLEAISSLSVPGGSSIANVEIIESQIIACQTQDGHAWYIASSDYSLLFSVSYPSMQPPKAFSVSDPTYSSVVTQSSVYIHHLPTAKSFYDRTLTGTSAQGSMKRQNFVYPFIRNSSESGSKLADESERIGASESSTISLPRHAMKVEDSKLKEWIKVNLVSSAAGSNSISAPKTLLLVDAVRTMGSSDTKASEQEGRSAAAASTTSGNPSTSKSKSASGSSKRLASHTTSSAAKEKGFDDTEVVSLRGFLDHDSRVVNMEKLRAMLLRYGSFPSRYRPLIWRFLLQLPDKASTESQFVNLTSRGPHPAVKSLMAPYPLPDTKLRNTLFNTLSALAWHSPVFTAVHFIPNLVFPFVKLYSSDIQSTVEVIMAFLANWGREFFTYYPHPPVAVVSFTAHTLQFLCPELHSHFAQHGVGTDVYVWDVLSSLFTEVLTRNEWLQVMDHAFANEPVWLFLFHVCWLTHLKGPLMGLTEHAQIVAALRRATPVNLPLIIQNTYQLQRNYLQTDLSHPYRRFVTFNGSAYPTHIECNESIITTRVRELEKVQAHETDILNMRDRISQVKKQLMQAAMLEDAFVGKQKAIVASQFEATNDVWIQQVQLEKERQRLRDIENEARLGALHEQLRSAQRIEAMQREIHASAAGSRDAEIDRQREVMKWDFANRMANQEMERLEAGARMKLAAVLHTAEALAEQTHSQQSQFVASMGGSALDHHNAATQEEATNEHDATIVPPYPTQSSPEMNPYDRVAENSSTEYRSDVNVNPLQSQTVVNAANPAVTSLSGATTSTPQTSCASDPVGYYRSLQEDIRRGVQVSQAHQQHTIANLNSRYAKALLHDEEDSHTDVTEPICDDEDVASVDAEPLLRPEAKRPTGLSTRWGYEVSVTSETTQSSSMTKALLRAQPRGFYSK